MVIIIRSSQTAISLSGPTGSGNAISEMRIPQLGTVAGMIALQDLASLAVLPVIEHSQNVVDLSNFN
jgi:hypothetical protein